MAAELPVVYLAFANAPDAHLDLLKTESREVLRALQPLAESGKIEVHREESTELGELYTDLLEHGDRIVIFHYGGHADGTMLQLEGGSGSSVGLARLLGQQDSLKLVFLNGCASQGHAPLLIEAGVPAVIATAVPIGDRKAQEFATAFYAALAEGRSIPQAFESGRGFVEGKHGPGAGSGLTFTRNIRRAGATPPSPVLEWSLFTREDAADDIEQWRLADAQAAWRVQLTDARGPIRDLDGNALTVEHRLPGRTVPALRCRTCGTASTAPSAETACPVCGSGEVERGPLRTRIAGQAVPFAVTEEDARRFVLAHAGHGNASDEGSGTSSPEIRIQGLFLPVWVFDADLRATLEAERGWNRALASVTPDFQWEPVRDVIDLRLDAFLVPAGTAPAGQATGKPDWYWELDRAEPRERGESAVPSVLLDRPIQSAFDELAAHIASEAEAEAESRVGGQQRRNLSLDTRYRGVSARTVLLPHWFATLERMGDRSHFVVNGQTGAVRPLPLPAPATTLAAAAAADERTAPAAGVHTYVQPPGDGARMSGRTFEPNAEPAGAGDAVSVFSGIGIGLMVGVLLGLAVSPVVGIFVGALGTGLAALLGLNDRHFNRAKGLRIGSFGLAAIVGAGAGIWIRTHDLFSPSLESQKAAYVALGYSEREALDLLAPRLRGMGAAAGGGSGASGEGAATFAAAGVSTAASVLFSSPVEISACASLTTAYDAELSPDDVVGNFRLEGAGWKSLADSAAAALDGADRKPLLFIARDAACGSPPPKPAAERCRRLDAAVAARSPADLETEFAADDALRPVLERVQREITPKGRAAALRLLGGVLCATSS